MRREPEHFGDQELNLVYVAKKLEEALRVEEALTTAGFDYLAEPDTYKGGVVFQSERVGVFFYVAPASDSGARSALERGGFKPYPLGQGG
jgi:hypothetical protein